MPRWTYDEPADSLLADPAAPFRMGQTVRITPGTYHWCPRPAYATIIGEGAHPNTWKVAYCGTRMTFHADELSDGTGHGGEAAGIDMSQVLDAAERAELAQKPAEVAFWEHIAEADEPNPAGAR